jgi:hypothetical protein
MSETTYRTSYYEVSAHFLPGLVLVGPLWGIPKSPYYAGRVWTETWSGPLVWFALSLSVVLIAAYIVGHIAQGVAACLISRRLMLTYVARTASAQTRERVRRVLELHGTMAPGPLGQLVALDELELTCPDRELLVSRQHLYRGFMVAFLVLAALIVGVLARAWLWNATTTVVAVGVCLGVAGVFWLRYREFVRLEVQAVVAEALRGTADPGHAPPLLAEELVR